MSHTKEPWSYKDNETFFEIHGGDGWQLGDTCASNCNGNKQLCEANARRIVACVNACAGLTQDHFDGGWNAKELIAYAANIEKERDQLSELCVELLDAVKNSSIAVYHEPAFQFSAFSEDADWPEWAKKLMDSNHEAITKAERVLGGDNAN